MQVRLFHIEIEAPSTQDATRVANFQRNCIHTGRDASDTNLVIVMSQYGIPRLFHTPV